MDTQKIKAHEIEEMNYTDFIAFLSETNRCPGGKNTIRRIREVLHIDINTKILDIGSNTGFTSLELARITPASIQGIDVSEACVEEANLYLNKESESLRSRVNFQVASAYNIPFLDEEFNLLMVGGATSFMEEKKRALDEYFRVLKPWGFLVSSPLAYHTKPPADLVQKVSNLIDVHIEPMMVGEWSKKVVEEVEGFEIYLEESYTLSSRTKEEIDLYVEYFLSKEHIKELSDDVKSAIRKRWADTLSIFNENHKYLSYDLVFFRKRPMVEEPELFI